MIDCDGTHMRPEMYDILPGDVVRWRQNGRWQQAQINAVERGTTRIKAVFDAVLTLPPDFFPY